VRALALAVVLVLFRTSGGIDLTAVPEPDCGDGPVGAQATDGPEPQGVRP